MVIRIWTYSTAAENAARFEEFESTVGLSMMQEQAGCLGVELFRSQQAPGEGLAGYIIISRWESTELLQAALASQSWRDEVQVFLAQGFGEGNGSIQHYDLVAGKVL